MSRNLTPVPCLNDEDPRDFGEEDIEKIMINSKLPFQDVSKDVRNKYKQGNNGNTTTSNNHTSSHKSKSNNIRKSRLQHQQQKLKLAVESPSRYSAERLDYAVAVVLDTLKKKENTSGISRELLRKAAISRGICDTGLVDFVLSSIHNLIVGKYIVCRTKEGGKYKFTFCECKEFSSVAEEIAPEKRKMSAERLKAAADVIMNALKEAESSMSREDLRKTATSRGICDTGLLDWVLKSINSTIVGKYIVCRAKNPDTKKLEFTIHELHCEDAPESTSAGPTSTTTIISYNASGASAASISGGIGGSDFFPGSHTHTASRELSDSFDTDLLLISDKNKMGSDIESCYNEKTMVDIQPLEETKRNLTSDDTDSLDKQIGTLRNEIEFLHSHKSAEIEFLYREKLGLENDVEFLNKQKEELRSDIESLNNEKTKLGADTELLYKEKTALNVEKDIELLDNEKAKIASELELLNKENFILVSEKNQLGTDVELLNQEKDRLHTDVEFLKEEKDKLHTDVEFLKEEKDTLHKVLSEEKDEFIHSAIHEVQQQLLKQMESEKVTRNTMIGVKRMRGDQVLLNYREKKRASAERGH